MINIEKPSKNNGDNMPKTEKIYTKNINVRISTDQYKKWNKYAKANGFDNISKVVRYATEGLIDGTFHKNESTNKNGVLREKIEHIEKDNKEILKSYNEILKFLVKKAPEPKDLQLREYQKQLIINLLQEKPRDEEELEKMLEVSEIEVLSIINDLLEMGIIEHYKDKYKVV